MSEMRGYLEFTVDVAKKQVLQQPGVQIPKAIVRIAEKASYVAKLWNKLLRKVKYRGGFLVFFSKPCQILPTPETSLGSNIYPPYLVTP
jgi:hypothetical protein